MNWTVSEVIGGHGLSNSTKAVTARATSQQTGTEDRVVPHNRCQAKIYVVFTMRESKFVWGQPGKCPGKGRQMNKRIMDGKIW